MTVFGIATLVFNGLEIAMYATMGNKCVSNIVFAHPTLQLLLNILQLNFFFIRPQVNDMQNSIHLIGSIDKSFARF